MNTLEFISSEKVRRFCKIHSRRFLDHTENVQTAQQSVRAACREESQRGFGEGIVLEAPGAFVKALRMTAAISEVFGTQGWMGSDRRVVKNAGRSLRQPCVKIRSFTPNRILRQARILE